MDKQETVKILEYLKANQSQLWRNETDDGMKKIANVWHEHFESYSYSAVLKAVQKFIATNTSGSLATITLIQQQLSVSRAIRNKTFRAYCLKNNEIVKIVYHLEGKPYKEDIVDEDGRIYADPDEEINRMLIARVRRTGMLLTPEEAQREYDELDRKRA